MKTTRTTPVPCKIRFKSFYGKTRRGGERVNDIGTRAERRHPSFITKAGSAKCLNVKRTYYYNIYRPHRTTCFRFRSVYSVSCPRHGPMFFVVKTRDILCACRRDRPSLNAFGCFPYPSEAVAVHKQSNPGAGRRGADAKIVTESLHRFRRVTNGYFIIFIRAANNVRRRSCAEK